MAQQIDTHLIINGIANGSPYSTQEPTIVFNNLPFSVWGAMSSPRTVTGKVVGLANPQQYRVALFALESKTQIMGNTAWLTSVASDGTFSLAVQQSATVYCATLMTPGFAQSYFASTFPGGSGTITSLPSPAEHPGDVLLMLAVPAGLNRRLVQPFDHSNPVIKPGDAFQKPGQMHRTLVPATSTQGMPDPNNPAQVGQLWNMLTMTGGPSVLAFTLTTQHHDGTAGLGAFAMGVYVYGNKMYVLAGAGPAPSQRLETAPMIVSQSIVDWKAFAPSMIQLGVAATILPEKIMLAVDVVNVEQSYMETFLEALEKVTFKLLGLTFSML